MTASLHLRSQLKFWQESRVSDENQTVTDVYGIAHHKTGLAGYAWYSSPSMLLLLAPSMLLLACHIKLSSTENDDLHGPFYVAGSFMSEHYSN